MRRAKDCAVPVGHEQVVTLVQAIGACLCRIVSAYVSQGWAMFEYVYQLPGLSRPSPANRSSISQFSVSSFAVGCRIEFMAGSGGFWGQRTSLRDLQGFLGVNVPHFGGVVLWVSREMYLSLPKP